MDDTIYQAPEGYLTMADARERLGISKTTIAKKVRQGLLQTYQDHRNGRVRLVKVEGGERLGQPVANPPGEPRKPTPARNADLERKSRPSRVQKAREGE